MGAVARGAPVQRRADTGRAGRTTRPARCSYADARTANTDTNSRDPANTDSYADAPAYGNTHSLNLRARVERSAP